MKSILKKCAQAAVLIGAVVLSSTSLASADNWKCYTYIPSPTHVVYVGMVAAMERFKAETDGEIDFRCSVGGSVPIDGNSVVPALADGLIDIASSSFSSGVIPVTSFYGLPGLFDTHEDLEKGFAAAWPTLTAEFEKQGVVLLGKYVYPRQVIWSKGPVVKLADLAGRSVRVATVEHSEFVKAFGGIPVTMPAADVGPALQRGMVSVVLTAASGGGRLWIDFLDQTSDIGPGYAVSYLLASKQKFDALSAENQEKLRRIGAEAGDSITEEMFGQNKSALEEFVKDRGLKTFPGDPEQDALLTSTMKPYWDRWADERGEVAKDMLKLVRDAIGR